MNAQKASTGRACDIVAAVYDRRTSPDVASAPCANPPSFGVRRLASAFSLCLPPSAAISAVTLCSIRPLCPLCPIPFVPKNPTSVAPNCS